MLGHQGRGRRGLLGRVPSRRPSGPDAVEKALTELAIAGYEVVSGIACSRGHLDHLVIGPTGAYAIEVERWTGRVRERRGGRLMCGDRSEEASAQRARDLASEVRSKLESVGLEAWVHSLIVLPRASVPTGALRVGAVTVVEAGELARLIRSRRSYLTREEVDRAVSVLDAGDRTRSGHRM